MEKKLKRFLIPRKELVHHIDGDRKNNSPINLKLSNPKDHAKGHIGERNKNGTFACLSEQFHKEKYRLYDIDRNIIQIYTLNELISKTFRKGKFEYRGKFTGLKDKNGKEIYEGDIVSYWNGTISIVDYETDIKYENLYYIKTENKIATVCFERGCFCLKNNNPVSCFSGESELEVIGNIYENPELLK